MAQGPVIQVLSKQNYNDQHLVTLPAALPLPRLAPSSLRISTTIMSLTTNNLTYARLAFLLGWWDVHPLPSSIPAEYSDPNAYGRISAWGYGTVVESTLTGSEAMQIPIGTQMYGYLPIGTLPVDMHVEVSKTVPGQFFEVSEQRSKLMPVYNRYMFYPPATTSEQKQSQGIDSLYQVLFETGYMMNRFIFAWDPKELSEPGTELGRDDSARNWTIENAQIGTDTVMLLFAASGKTGLSFAHQLKRSRPSGSKPGLVVAVGSDSSRAFAEGTGLFDRILKYNADSTSDVAAELGLKPASKIVVCDFGSRDSAAARWVEMLKPTYNNIIYLGVGGEVVPDAPDRTMEKFMARMGSSVIQVNASGLRTQAMKILGERKYFEEFLKEWKACKAGGGFKGQHLVWGEGMEAVGKAWEKICKGGFRPDEGLVFTLPCKL